MGRGDLTDEEWVLIGGLLPAKRGRWSRPAHDNRRFLIEVQLERFEFSTQYVSI